MNVMDLINSEQEELDKSRDKAYLDIVNKANECHNTPKQRYYLISSGAKSIVSELALKLKQAKNN